MESQWLAKLKEEALASGATTVDFDLALTDLEEKELIGTGPMDVYSDVSSVVTALAVYSKREYAYLTAKGYKATR